MERQQLADRGFVADAAKGQLIALVARVPLWFLQSGTRPRDNGI
jgi:hypothetical protein